MQISTLPISQQPDRLLSTLGRLVMLRSFLSTPVSLRLVEFCEAVKTRGDASYFYHALTAELVESRSRCVTGDLWKDFIFSFLFETPNFISVNSAVCTVDPPAVKAMKHDLALMKELFDIEDSMLIGWFENLAQATRSDSKGIDDREDKITRMSLSAWGVPTKDKPVQVAQQAPRAEKPRADSFRWNYEAPKEPVIYAADSALALMYRKFLSQDDWSALYEPLCAFHLEYGHGPFLRYRMLKADESSISGWDIEAHDWDDLIGISKQKEKLYAQTLRFLHTGSGENSLIYGATGMGKTAMILSLVKELDGLRIVRMSHRDPLALSHTLSQIGSQPFRTIALLDDISTSERDYKKLRYALSDTDNLDRVLIYATSQKPAPDGALFPVQIGVDEPSKEDFKQLVNDFLGSDISFNDTRGVSSACDEWFEAKGELSARAAKHIAQSLIRKGNSH